MAFTLYGSGMKQHVAAASATGNGGSLLHKCLPCKSKPCSCLQARDWQLASCRTCTPVTHVHAACASCRTLQAAGVLAWLSACKSNSSTQAVRHVGRLYLPQLFDKQLPDPCLYSCIGCRECRLTAVRCELWDSDSSVPTT
jgi:hypothetical protein